MRIYHTTGNQIFSQNSIAELVQKTFKVPPMLRLCAILQMFKNMEKQDIVRYGRTGKGKMYYFRIGRYFQRRLNTMSTGSHNKMKGAIGAGDTKPFPEKYSRNTYKSLPTS